MAEPFDNYPPPPPLWNCRRVTRIILLFLEVYIKSVSSRRNLRGPWFFFCMGLESLGGGTLRFFPEIIAHVTWSMGKKVCPKFHFYSPYHVLCSAFPPLGCFITQREISINCAQGFQKSIPDSAQLIPVFRPHKNWGRVFSVAL